MELKKLRNVSGYYVYTDIVINEKKLVAMVDTGCTTLIVDKDLLDFKVKKVVNLAGVNGESKAYSIIGNVTIGGITKKKEIILTDFGMINEVCKSSGVKTYNAIIGIKEIKQFNLQKSIYAALQSK